MYFENGIALQCTASTLLPRGPNVMSGHRRKHSATEYLNTYFARSEKAVRTTYYGQVFRTSDRPRKASTKIGRIISSNTAVLKTTRTHCMDSQRSRNRFGSENGQMKDLKHLDGSRTTIFDDRGVTEPLLKESSIFQEHFSLFV